MILDEPSAHLDDDAAGALLPDLVEGVTAATGVLLITHRLDGLGLFDRVVVLERGRVVEAGPVRELRAKDGRFAALERWQEVSLSS